MSTIIRDAVAARLQAGDTLKSVAQASDIDPSALTRFMQGRDARGHTLDRLAAGLGLELRPVRKGNR